MNTSRSPVHNRFLPLFFFFFLLLTFIVGEVASFVPLFPQLPRSTKLAEGRIATAPASALFSSTPSPSVDTATTTATTAVAESSDNNNNNNNNMDNNRLEEYQQQANRLASSFVPNPFDPIPWLSNQHIQTIGSFFVRDKPECAWVANDGISTMIRSAFSTNKKEQVPFWDERERIETPDNDWFHVDYKYATTTTSTMDDKTNGLMILVHGLQSNSNSTLCVDMARAYTSLGLDVACINFRGCSGTPNDTAGGYHLGFTNDLKLFLTRQQQQQQQSTEDTDDDDDNKTTKKRPLYLSGFSLGANVVVKALGELKTAAVDDYNIRGAVAFCVTLDAERNSPVLAQRGINREVYTRNLLQSLQDVAREKQARFGTVSTGIDFERAIQCDTIFDFDDAFVAPFYGFDNANDYYRRTSSVRFLPDVAVPLMILNSQDDPFMDSSFFPTELARENGGRAPVKMVRTPHGGHLGYVFHRLPKGQDRPDVSWGPYEMKRFIQHVMKQQEDAE